MRRGILFILLLLFGISSCKQDHFLETTDRSGLTDATIWESEGNADVYLNDCYHDLPPKSNYPDNLDNFTDDNNPDFYYTSWNWKKGKVDPSGGASGSVWFGTTGPAQEEGWATLYNKVRKLNKFIKEITKNRENYSDDWFNKRLDEARFLRAYYYSEQFVLLGGLVLIKEPQVRQTMTEDEMYLPRSTFEETFEFLIGELTDIVNNAYLPVKYNHGDADAGRATLGAALMLKGWLQLFAASPAFNSSEPAVPNEEGNKDLQSFATPDHERWADAAATFRQFIETWGHKGSGIYDLFSPMKEFWYEANEYNCEVIWDRQHVPGTMVNTFDTYGGPVWINRTYYTWGNYNPTQEIVDQYQMAGGLDIDDPASGYDDQNPYVGREKRFYDFIVYNGCIYKQDWMSEPDTIYTMPWMYPWWWNIEWIDYDDNYARTGYYYKKRLDNLHPPRSKLNGINHVYYRYAEVILGYAEAQNEAVGPDASVYEAVNAIRTRPGTDLPPLPAGLSQSEMREAIQRERRIELVFEHKRLFDLWRWKQAEVNMNQVLHGIEIRNTVPSDNSGIWTYTTIPLQSPHVFKQKMYFNPIPQTVIDRNPKILQNWDYQ
ncbi:MAG: RagB/SusD family nutrient uptake outer membrane protein [Bacteroidales bacterium]|nr:RagB/SusD family nutrient uptake outer membrane protein [Bacteroidales bacterium]